MKLDPAERLLTLSHVVDEVPAEAGGELLRTFSTACFAVLRQMRGSATEAEARFAIDRARDALLAATKGTPPASTGEWRCRCPSDPAFDKSINPPYIARCDACGESRPTR